MHSRTVFLLCSLVLFAACENKKQKAEILLNAINDNLLLSIETLNRSTAVTLYELEDKLTDPATQQRASIWYPKAQLIKGITDTLNKNIEDIQHQIKGQEFTADQRKRLSLLMDEYERKLTAIDSNLNIAFDYSNYLKFSKLDSSEKNSIWLDRISEKYTISEINCILKLLQHHSKIIENRTINYCFNKIPDYYCGYEQYHALFNISSSYVQPGEKIEITTGIGSFSKAAMPTIFVNGKETDLSESAMATYKFRAPEKPGNYIIPVRIKFKDSDGSDRETIRNIEYTVAPLANP